MSVTDLPRRRYKPNSPLTAIERSILVASLSRSDAQISASTGYAISTLKNTRHNIYRKLGVHSKGEAALAAGIIQFSGEAPS